MQFSLSLRIILHCPGPEACLASSSRCSLATSRLANLPLRGPAMNTPFRKFLSQGRRKQAQSRTSARARAAHGVRGNRGRRPQRGGRCQPLRLVERRRLGVVFNGQARRRPAAARTTRAAAAATRSAQLAPRAAGKASQTATVHRVSANRYRGSFYNSDFNVRGSIRVVVHGRSQSVSLSGDGASASLSLSKR